MKVQNTKDFGEGRLKAILFGDSGSGKTSTAKTLPARSLIVSVESGLLSISDKDIAVVDVTTNDNGEVIPRPERILRLGEIYQWLLTEEPRKSYDNIFIDGISEISDNLFEKYKRKYPEKKDGLNMWEDIKTDIRSIVRSFRDLPMYNVVFTALETREQDENMRMFYGPFAQPKSFAAELPKFFDFVWRLEVDSKGQRMIRTQPTDSIRAKSRNTDSVRLNELEPADLSAIFNKLKGIATT